MVLLGIMTILFYLIPAVHIEDTTEYTADANLFIATFGGSFSLGYPGGNFSFVPCAGLIVAFCLSVVAIILTFLKCKFRLAALFAFPFYIAAGVLVACTIPLVNATNLGVISFTQDYSMIGGSITVATMWCVLGFFALIDFIAAAAKPKQQPVAY